MNDRLKEIKERTESMMGVKGRYVSVRKDDLSWLINALELTNLAYEGLNKQYKEAHQERVKLRDQLKEMATK